VTIWTLLKGVRPWVRPEARGRGQERRLVHFHVPCPLPDLLTEAPRASFSETIKTVAQVTALRSLSFVFAHFRQIRPDFLARCKLLPLPGRQWIRVAERGIRTRELSNSASSLPRQSEAAAALPAQIPHSTLHAPMLHDFFHPPWTADVQPAQVSWS